MIEGRIATRPVFGMCKNCGNRTRKEACIDCFQWFARGNPGKNVAKW